ncbi:MAG TPA: GRP family sugar transporter, partial [Candidatus Acidoferrum sp.]|nr:GRP family sugar transporter [Candidatus Acidoferrum sp.]
LMLGGFVWVIGDLFQQYAAKYLGISRGIPLSNTNQLWGLLWGVFVFGELHGRTAAHSAKIVGGSLLMAAGAGAIALASVTRGEHANWREAIEREVTRYGIGRDYAKSAITGEADDASVGRSWLDWLFLAFTSGVFAYLAAVARTPQIALHWPALILLSLASLLVLGGAALSLYQTTRFR